jgi:hypothetical protein
MNRPSANRLEAAAAISSILFSLSSVMFQIACTPGPHVPRRRSLFVTGDTYEK